MQTTRAIVGLMLICLIVAGCDNKEETTAPGGSGNNLSREALHKDLAIKYEEMANLLTHVKDQASAEKAAPKVTAIADDVKRISRQILSLGMPTSQENDDIKRQFAARRTAAENTIQTEGKRIEADPRLVAVKLALQGIGNSSGNDGGDD